MAGVGMSKTGFATCVRQGSPTAGQGFRQSHDSEVVIRRLIKGLFEGGEGRIVPDPIKGRIVPEPPTG